MLIVALYLSISQVFLMEATHCLKISIKVVPSLRLVKIQVIFDCLISEEYRRSESQYRKRACSFKSQPFHFFLFGGTQKHKLPLYRDMNRPLTEIVWVLISLQEVGSNPDKSFELQCLSILYALLQQASKLLITLKNEIEIKLSG